MNVSMNRVAVVRLVIRKLTGREIERLPINAVKTRLLVEGRHIAHEQVKEATLSDDTEKGNCHYGNGTTKHHRHFRSFQITTSSGNTFSFGLQEMAGQDAGTLFKTFTCAVDELAEFVTSGSEDEENVFSELVASIRSTMSDYVWILHEV